MQPRECSDAALTQQFGELTLREREAARLVAQGKSNRAIADELVVGVSTVEAHISHIFTKPGFSSLVTARGCVEQAEDCPG